MTRTFQFKRGEVVCNIKTNDYIEIVGISESEVGRNYYLVKYQTSIDKQIPIGRILVCYDSEFDSQHVRMASTRRFKPGTNILYKNVRHHVFEYGPEIFMGNPGYVLTNEDNDEQFIVSASDIEENGKNL